MKPREIEFNAWLPALTMLVMKAAIMPTGRLMVHKDDIEAAMRGKLQVLGDTICAIGNPTPLLSIIEINGYLFFDQADYIPLQLVATHEGEKIFESDIIELPSGELRIITWEGIFYTMRPIASRNGFYPLMWADKFKKIGNMFLNMPDLWPNNLLN